MAKLPAMLKGSSGKERMGKGFASIKRGLRQAIRHRSGNRVPGLKLYVSPQVYVKAVRERCAPSTTRRRASAPVRRAARAK